MKLYRLFIKNGIIPFVVLGIILLFIGVFLIGQSLSGSFLPHDIDIIGMTAKQLSSYKNGRIVEFMFHDRVSYGGALITVGILYLWLALVPLQKKEPWAWWVLFISGIYGFASFFSYLGYNYFDSWHALGTIAITPLFILGLYHSYQKESKYQFNSLFKKQKRFHLSSRLGRGNCLMLLSALALFLGGVIIMIVGMTSVFVPQDLAFMDIKVCGLQDISSKLIPVIAHDRASFGGSLATIGIMLYFIIWYAKPSKILWETLAIAITIGYSSAILVHFVIGYLNFSHLFPAFLGLFIFIMGLFWIENDWSKK
ncbi:hypothetical protein IWQ47_002769 [Aquimarina sp. EL_43]|uniref:hypothetical protein n=1 Tax=unclassified Aquimarina TaxID=2627091 RepID=UPI0018CB99D6|nr:MULTISPECIES: hypothetical protein [unclassified Aquimarina]MBG6131362.1 hypothetical protein [Aquimarina sp. EL_35]MBG6151755.1 hypothetical protein [Aquimarina sp. EL_32]MBG6169685.1 hypothetical protein [Aquimarina sp. EL_43]